MRRMLLIAGCLLACTAARARQFTVDDLTGMESYGQIVVAAASDALLVERRRPYREAPDFGYDTYFNSRILSRVRYTSLSHPGPLVPLFEQAPDAGYWLGSLSPDGSRIVVFRLQRRRLSLGVLDLRSRRVAWIATPPDLPDSAPGPIWMDSDHLVFVGMTRPRLPGAILTGSAMTGDLIALWRRQAAGLTSRTIVSTSDGPSPDDAVRRVVVVDVSRGAERSIFTGDVVDISVSADGRSFAVVTAEKPVAPPATTIDVGFDPRRRSLHLLDPETGRSIDIPGDVLRGGLCWNEQAELLVALRRRDDLPQSARWFSIGAGGTMRALGGSDVHAAVGGARGQEAPASGIWAGGVPIARIRDDRRGSFWARLTGRGAFKMPIADDAEPVGRTGGTAWLLASGTLTAVTPRSTRVVARDVLQVGGVLLDPYMAGVRPRSLSPDRTVVLRSTGGLRVLGSVTPRGRQGAGFGIGQEDVPVASIGASTVLRTLDGQGVETLSIVGPGGSRRILDRLNATLGDVDLPEALDLPFHVDGSRLHDWLLLPAGSRGRTPLIVIPYPGLTYGAQRPREATVGRLSVPINPLLLTAAGYAVLLPSMPYGPGDPNPASDLLPRIDAAVDAAVATGRIDPDRIGLQGHSFGAYAALTVATRSDRYKAVVAANGPYDLLATHGSMAVSNKLRMDYGMPVGASAGWTEGGQGGMRDPPSKAGDRYLAASPIMKLDQAKRPILLIAGDLDPIDMTQAERAFMELYRYGKDATLVRYWGEGHANASAGNIRDYWSTIIGFFDSSLAVEGGRTGVRAAGRQSAAGMPR